MRNFEIEEFTNIRLSFFKCFSYSSLIYHTLTFSIKKESVNLPDSREGTVIKMKLCFLIAVGSAQL